MFLEPSNSNSPPPAVRQHSWSIAFRLVLLFTVAAAVLLLLAMAAAYWTVTQHVIHENDRYITEKLAALRADIAADARLESLNRELQIIRAADNLIDIGPGRGERGGDLVWSGELEAFMGGSAAPRAMPNSGASATADIERRSARSTRALFRDHA